MKLYKKKILNVNVGKCLLVSLITFVIRYFYANVYLGFHNSLVTITEGVRSQIYFGGILIDHSFDLISLSFFAILFILEICYLTMDLFNDANDNMVILLPRYGKKHIIYKDEIMIYFGLDPKSKKKVNKYSLGMRQKLALCQALMEHPKILLLDEPTNALDQHSIDLFRERILEEKKNDTITILTSHNKEDIEILADEKICMEFGKIKELM